MKFNVGDRVVIDDLVRATVLEPGEQQAVVEVGNLLRYKQVIANNRLRIEKEETIRGSLLLEAKDLVEGDRNVTHGSATENFTTIAKLWSTQLSGKLEEDIAPHEVAQMMIHLKLARMRTSPDNKDHWLDLAGYASLGFEATQ